VKVVYYGALPHHSSPQVPEKYRVVGFRKKTLSNWKMEIIADEPQILVYVPHERR
jgi:hypothetical protein